MQTKSLPRRHYPHAPITEAIIAIGYELPGEVGLDDLLKVQPELSPDYPKRAEQLAVHVEVNAAERTGRTTAPEILGYQYFSHDRKRIARVTRGEYTFSQLAPYERWETFETEAKRLWRIVEKHISPRRITRVGVRFINRIDIPCPQGRGVDLDIYFRAAPRIPPELPQMMSTYFVRMEVPFDVPDRVLILAIAAAPPSSPEMVSTLLDLDAIQQNIDVDASAAWLTIEELRDVKDAAFEASITDAARELFR